MKKAIESGRIAAAVLPDGIIDPVKADALWHSNTNPAMQREGPAVVEGVKVSKAKHAKRAKASPKAAPMPAMDEDPGEGYMPSNLSDGAIFPLLEGELAYGGMSCRTRRHAVLGKALLSPWDTSEFRAGAVDMSSMEKRDIQ